MGGALTPERLAGLEALTGIAGAVAPLAFPVRFERRFGPGPTVTPGAARALAAPQALTGVSQALGGIREFRAQPTLEQLAQISRGLRPAPTVPQVPTAVAPVSAPTGAALPTPVVEFRPTPRAPLGTADELLAQQQERERVRAAGFPVPSRPIPQEELTARLARLRELARPGQVTETFARAQRARELPPALEIVPPEPGAAAAAPAEVAPIFPPEVGRLRVPPSALGGLVTELFREPERPERGRTIPRDQLIGALTRRGVDPTDAQATIINLPELLTPQEFNAIISGAAPRRPPETVTTFKRGEDIVTEFRDPFTGEVVRTEVAPRAAPVGPEPALTTIQIESQFNTFLDNATTASRIGATAFDPGRIDRRLRIRNLQSQIAGASEPVQQRVQQFIEAEETSLAEQQTDIQVAISAIEQGADRELVRERLFLKHADLRGNRQLPRALR